MQFFKIETTAYDYVGMAHIKVNSGDDIGDFLTLADIPRFQLIVPCKE
jgi:hypothetical protein